MHILILPICPLGALDCKLSILWIQCGAKNLIPGCEFPPRLEGYCINIFLPFFNSNEISSSKYPTGHFPYRRRRRRRRRRFRTLFLQKWSQFIFQVSRCQAKSLGMGWRRISTLQFPICFRDFREQTSCSHILPQITSNLWEGKASFSFFFGGTSSRAIVIQ